MAFSVELNHNTRSRMSAEKSSLSSSSTIVWLSIRSTPTTALARGFTPCEENNWARTFHPYAPLVAGKRVAIIGLIAFSWAIAFFEYCLQVPANRLGFKDSGGPFDIMQLKVIQEVITLHLQFG